MKTLLFSALILCAALLPAAENGTCFRADLDSEPDDRTIELIPLFPEDQLAPEPQKWIPGERRKYTLTVRSAPLPLQRWSEEVFSFQAKQEGRILIRLLSASQEQSAGGALLLTEIRVNGKLHPNGDFTHTRELRTRTVPEGFFFAGAGAAWLKNAGPENMPAVRVDSRGGLLFFLSVKAGETCRIGVKVKPVPESAAPSPASGD